MHFTAYFGADTIIAGSVNVLESWQYLAHLHFRLLNTGLCSDRGTVKRWDSEGPLTI